MGFRVYLKWVMKVCIRGFQKLYKSITKAFRKGFSGLLSSRSLGCRIQERGAMVKYRVFRRGPSWGVQGSVVGRTRVFGTWKLRVSGSWV